MVISATMWRPPWRLIHAGNSTLATAIPATTRPVSATNNQMGPTHGRTARPTNVSTAPMVMVRVSPRRIASGTATMPSNANRKPGIAVMAPAYDASAPNAASVSSSTGPTEEMPERRFTATVMTATKRSAEERTVPVRASWEVLVRALALARVLAPVPVPWTVPWTVPGRPVRASAPVPSMRRAEREERSSGVLDISPLSARVWWLVNFCVSRAPVNTERPPTLNDRQRQTAADGFHHRPPSAGDKRVATLLPYPRNALSESVAPLILTNS